MAQLTMLGQKREEFVEWHKEQVKKYLTVAQRSYSHQLAKHLAKPVLIEESTVYEQALADAIGEILKADATAPLRGREPIYEEMTRKELCNSLTEFVEELSTHIRGDSIRRMSKVTGRREKAVATLPPDIVLA